MGSFVAGFVGIQAISRLLHQFMPSHVVDCDHTHRESAASDAYSPSRSRQQSRASRTRRRRSSVRSAREPSIPRNRHTEPSEHTPLLDSNGKPGPTPAPERFPSAPEGEMAQHSTSSLLDNRARATTVGTDLVRRPSMFQMPQRVMSFVRDTKCDCSAQGSCYGYSDPCGQECFKHISNRAQPTQKHPAILRTTTGPFYPQSGSPFHGGRHDLAHDHDRPRSPHFRTSRATSREPLTIPEEDDEECGVSDDERCFSDTSTEDIEAQHHHHVPANAFLSIGLQTSIAIALHKFPEGFITYATNHANPALGFNVFMALFVHNISEGFAMCLPLYMALGSRWRAMAWSAVLGGLSQPLGAAAAVAWFKLASRTHMAPSALAYAILFAITAGIMVSVALQLFVESLSLNHNRNLCIFFGFLGMVILGLSNALFAGH